MNKEKETIKKEPVITVLGHVDHGKSTLLEAIKEEIDITDSESGGITQHIGAYEVQVDGEKLTFIDTPGHEAFSAMRSRGAQVADVAILVVDSTKGVKQQTKEVIEFIKEEDIPVVVALNKIDRNTARPEKVKHQLSEEGLVVESLNGEIPSVKVSATEGDGIGDLLETLLLVAQMEKLEMDLSSSMEGVVIESLLDEHKGPVSTVIIKKGLLKKADTIGTNSAFGKVKSLTNFKGEEVKEATPGQPVRILGFKKAPKIGEKVKAFSNIKEAKENIEEEKERKKSKVLSEGGKKTFSMILKADVLGSLEAIEKMLKKIPQQKVSIKIIRSEVGNIGVSDIRIAESADACIFGFRVNIEENAEFFAKQKGVKLETYDVIYELVEKIRKEMRKVLKPKKKKVKRGRLKVLEIFKQSSGQQVIGGKITRGKILDEEAKVAIIRDKEVIGKGNLKNIQAKKKEIEKASQGRKIGMLITGAPKIKEDDILRIYKIKKSKRKLT